MSPPVELRAVVGWPGYYVTEHGQIVSTHQFPRLRVVAQHFHKRSGHWRVTLYRSGAKANRYVHSLVARAYIGRRPTPTHEVLHGDGDVSNNHVSNLRYGTRSENALDRERHRRERLAAEVAQEQDDDRSEADDSGLTYIPDAAMGF